MSKIYNATVEVELDENDFENIADDLRASIGEALGSETMWDYLSDEQQDNIVEQALKDFIEWITKN